MHARFSLESRRTMFRARVIAIESGQPEVTVASILAALFASAEVIEACERRKLSVTELIRQLGLEPHLQTLRDAEISLSARNVAFGSQEHIESMNPHRIECPASAEALRLIKELDQRDEVTTRDILERFAAERGAQIS